MLFRYNVLTDVLPGNDHKDVLELLFSDADSVEVKLVLNRLEMFKKMTIKVQNTTVTLRPAKILFDCVIELHPKMESRIGPNAPIIKNVNLKIALEKLLLTKESYIIKFEESTIRHLLRPSDVSRAELSACTTK